MIWCLGKEPPGNSMSKLGDVIVPFLEGETTLSCRKAWYTGGALVRTGSILAQTENWRTPSGNIAEKSSIGESVMNIEQVRRQWWSLIFLIDNWCDSMRTVRMMVQPEYYCSRALDITSVRKMKMRACSYCEHVRKCSQTIRNPPTSYQDDKFGSNGIDNNWVPVRQLGSIKC